MSFWPEPEYTTEPITRTYRLGVAPQLWVPFRWETMAGEDVTDQVLNSWRYAGPIPPK
jgi:hypothetical protein